MRPLKKNKIYRIGYFADGIWAYRAFKLLIRDISLGIEFICARYDSDDETLKQYAHKYDIDYLKHPDVNSKDFSRLLKRYNCDLFVSMSFDQIFKAHIINMPRHKIINCHAGKLPFYRGRNVLNWVLINDEKEFGITVHYIDEGIDTGDIILQKTYPITDQDTYKTLLECAYAECGKILYDSIKLIQGGDCPIIKQESIHKVGMYCRIRKKGDELINWAGTSRDVFNFIRALCRPGPMACSFIDGKKIKINSARLINNAPINKGIPGQVVGKTKSGFIVKTKDSILEITDIQYNGKIRLGDRLK